MHAQIPSRSLLNKRLLRDFLKEELDERQTRVVSSERALYLFDLEVFFCCLGLSPRVDGWLGVGWGVVPELKLTWVMRAAADGHAK
jgi:hypothetical protein